MKKTLITLMALGGIAWGNILPPLTGEFTWASDTAPSFTFTNGPLTLNITAYQTTTFTTTTTEGGETSVTSTTKNSAYRGVNDFGTLDLSGKYTPDINVGTGAGTWTLSFTITNTGNQAITLYSLGFDAFVFSGGNNNSLHEGDNKNRDVVFALSGDATGSVEHRFYAKNAEERIAGQTESIFFNPSTPIELAAGNGEASFSLLVSKGTENGGTFVGLTGMQVYIPEPATATLSLLALVGLAARRRRL